MPHALPAGHQVAEGRLRLAGKRPVATVVIRKDVAALLAARAGTDRRAPHAAVAEMKEVPAAGLWARPTGLQSLTVTGAELQWFEDELADLLWQMTGRVFTEAVHVIPRTDVEQAVEAVRAARVQLVAS